MKIHIGSGTVYLKGWVNVDVPAPFCYLASERPDLVKKFQTTEEQGYYAKHKKKTLAKFRQGAEITEYVCDRYGSFSFLPIKSSEGTEILARQSFEHLSITEARLALREMNRALAMSGTLRLDVPDADATLRLLKKTKDDFYIRHYLGPRKTEFGYHCMGYNRDTLRRLANEYGFTLYGDEDNIHLYPAITLVFNKIRDL